MMAAARAPGAATIYDIVDVAGSKKCSTSACSVWVMFNAAAARAGRRIVATLLCIAGAAHPTIETLYAESMTRRRSSLHDRRSTGPSLAPLPRLVNPWPPLEILSTDQVERILAAAYRVLEEAGIEIRSTAARQVFRRVARSSTSVR
jgi:hypothetical protein